MTGPLTLEELKAEAQKASYLVIRREGQAAWYPLKAWKGVTYYLVGNKVLVRGEVEQQVWCYVLG